MNVYSNNALRGDIGNMMNLTPEARSDGKELYELLTCLLSDITHLSRSASNLLQNIPIGTPPSKGTVSEDAVSHADALLRHAAELRQFVKRVQPPSSDTTYSRFSNCDTDDDNDTDDDIHDEEREVGADAVRHRLEENGTAASSSDSAVGTMRSTFASFAAMIDPPPHKYIFGLDVLRGCVLSRYRGARQFWVKRTGGSLFCFGSGGGAIDVIHIPSWSSRDGNTNLNGGASSSSIEKRMPMSPRQGRDTPSVVAVSSGTDKKGRKAVLYCNPNAGLAEVATGLGLIGGNTHPDKDNDDTDATCWTEYYISHGYDVYLFNYCGYGRSHAGTSQTEFRPGCIRSVRRLFYAAFLSFKPTSQTLKLDAVAVAKHILEYENVNQLIIHGESIGGMAAAGAARALSHSSNSTLTNGNVSLLICDRTFCNLEAVAQRLVGSWTGNAIRLLTFKSWNTDVVGDFLAAKCPKVVANDAADEIIHDYSSLKSGLSFASELTRGVSNSVGWMMSAPIEYRLADLEGVSIVNPAALTFNAFQVNPPTWPADKRVTWKEAFHFGFCLKRIGKLATAAKKMNSSSNDFVSNDEQEGIEVSFAGGSGGHSLDNEAKTNRANQTELIELWNTLSCCEGLCGRPLGQAVKEGFDCTVSWLCCAVVMGPDVVTKSAERRRRESKAQADTNGSFSIQPKDFDCRPIGYQREETATMKHPIPLPNVLSYLNVCRRSKLLEGKWLIMA